MKSTVDSWHSGPIALALLNLIPIDNFKFQINNLDEISLAANSDGTDFLDKTILSSEKFFMSAKFVYEN